MRKILFLLISFFCVATIEATNIEFKGYMSSTLINGFVREAAFYNDTCYFISADGKRILMSTPSGTKYNNSLTQIVFNNAWRIYVNDIHIIIQDNNSIKIYNKNAQLIRQISLPSNVFFFYFWVKNKSEIMVGTSDELLVYDYNSCNLLGQRKIENRLLRNRFANDGQRLFYNNSGNVIKYEYSNNSINEFVITSPKLSEMEADTSRYYYLACFGNNKSMWFDYYKRDSIYVMNSDFSNIIEKKQIFQNALPPSGDQLYSESGNPRMKIYYAQDKYYLIKIFTNYVKIYWLTD